MKNYTPKGMRYNVSVLAWNKTFAKRGKFLLARVIVFVDDKGATSVYIPSLLTKAIYILLFPLLAQAYFFTGQFDEFKREILDVLFPLKRGAFGSDYTSRDSDNWEKLANLIDLKE